VEQISRRVSEVHRPHAQLTACLPSTSSSAQTYTNIAVSLRRFLNVAHSIVEHSNSGEKSFDSIRQSD